MHSHTSQIPVRTLTYHRAQSCNHHAACHVPPSFRRPYVATAYIHAPNKTPSAHPRRARPTQSRPWASHHAAILTRPIPPACGMHTEACRHVVHVARPIPPACGMPPPHSQGRRATPHPSTCLPHAAGTMLASQRGAAPKCAPPTPHRSDLSEWSLRQTDSASTLHSPTNERGSQHPGTPCHPPPHHSPT